MIKTAEIFRYALPLQAPVMLGGRLLKEREGFFIKITDDTGAVGWGEAAPVQDSGPGGLKETKRK